MRVLPRLNARNRVRLKPDGCRYLLIAAAALSVALSADSSRAKTPGSTYCFSGTCHRVKSIVETERLVGRNVTLSASYYDDCRRDAYNPCGLTSSGERFDPDRPDNAASPIYPDGTTLLVWSPDTKRAAVLRVNNAGPYWGNRKLDVSRATAEQLGFAGRGVANLQVRVVDAPSREEATYSKGRKYDPVPGYIGHYESADAAAAGMAALMGLEAIAPSMMALTGSAVVAARADPEARTEIAEATEAIDEKPAGRTSGRAIALKKDTGTNLGPHGAKPAGVQIAAAEQAPQAEAEGTQTADAKQAAEAERPAKAKRIAKTEAKAMSKPVAKQKRRIVVKKSRRQKSRVAAVKTRQSGMGTATRKSGLSASKAVSGAPKSIGAGPPNDNPWFRSSMRATRASMHTNSGA